MTLSRVLFVSMFACERAKGKSRSSAAQQSLWACRYGDLEAVEDFIAIGKDVNESDGEQRTPLHYAVAYNHEKIVDELHASGADLEAKVQLLCKAPPACSSGILKQTAHRTLMHGKVTLSNYYGSHSTGLTCFHEGKSLPEPSHTEALSR